MYNVVDWMGTTLLNGREQHWLVRMYNIDEWMCTNW